MIGKPFGRARRRETSAFGKEIDLIEDSMMPKHGRRSKLPRRLCCVCTLSSRG